jgi:hypothetical protein
VDREKCLALKNTLVGQTEPQLVPIGQFFEGNDDEGSIGCNLMPHPGIERFREVLVGLSKRPDVTGVFAVITELDPGEDMWPFSDTILVAGSMASESFGEAVAELEADEVGLAHPALVSALPPQARNGSALVAWWD